MPLEASIASKCDKLSVAAPLERYLTSIVPCGEGSPSRTVASRPLPKGPLPLNVPRVAVVLEGDLCHPEMYIQQK